MAGQIDEPGKRHLGLRAGQRVKSSTKDKKPLDAMALKPRRRLLDGTPGLVFDLERGILLDGRQEGLGYGELEVALP